MVEEGVIVHGEAEAERELVFVLLLEEDTVSVKDILRD